jgi:cell wall-associated NlpC family hydrolase
MSKGIAVAYSVVGGVLLYSGVKGAKITDTVGAALSGDFTTLNAAKPSEPITAQNDSGSTPSTAPATPAGGSANGQQILGDAMKYNGHKYVFGGASNPTTGWDCSSFASYVLGHDLNMTLPGNKSWAALTNSGKSHGPVADEFAHTPGFKKVGTDPTKGQPGDLLVWTGHVGFSTGNGGMFSAFTTQQGTLATAASAPYAFLGVFRSGA